MAIMGFLTSLVAPLIGKLAADETLAWLPWISRRLLLRAVSRLPQECRARYKEEWESDLLDTPGNLGKIIHSLGLVRAATGISRIAGLAGPSSLEAFARRSFDLLVAIFYLITTAPLFTLIIICIKLESPGPVFIKLQSVGAEGKPLRYYRFRTISLLVDQAPKLTRTGTLLRRVRLDNLPVFLSIVAGDMTLKGVWGRRVASGPTST
jgi:hypothetical protein